MGPAKIIYRVARTRQELEGAFSIVYKEYLKRGYIPKGYKSNLRISLYNALPTTTTFVAKQGRKVVAGVTLIPDSPLGVPMDKIYKEELDILRRDGCKIAEVSQLAIDTELFGKGFFSMFNFNKLMFIFKLFKVLFDYVMSINELTDLCIAVNPSHQYLYKFLYFEQFAGLKYYGPVNRAPAVALRLKLTGVGERVKRKGIYKIFIADKSDPISLKGKFKLDAGDLEYFFAKKSDIFKKSNAQQLRCVERYYPDLQVKNFL